MSELMLKEEIKLLFGKLVETMEDNITNEAMDDYVMRFIDEIDEEIYIRDNKIYLVQKPKYLTEEDIEEAVGYGADDGVCPCCGRSVYDYD
jgi:transcriptional regulator NrdR family protein